MTKSALLWQSFQGNGANYKTCLGFSRQLLGNVLVCPEKEKSGWRIISNEREELTMLHARSQCECLQHLILINIRLHSWSYRPITLGTTETAQGSSQPLQPAVGSFSLTLQHWSLWLFPL